MNDLKNHLGISVYGNLFYFNQKFKTILSLSVLLSIRLAIFVLLA